MRSRRRVEEFHYHSINTIYAILTKTTSLESSVGGSTPRESKTELHTVASEKGLSHEHIADVEQGIAPDTNITALPDRNTQDDRDPNIVDWDGPDDPENPLNWPFKKKLAATAVISTITLLT